MNTPTHVGVVGPKDSVEKVLAFQDVFPSLKLTGHAYERETEAPLLVKKMMNQVDSILFTGPVPFHLTRGKLGELLPMFFVSYAGTTLYRSFFKLQQMPNVKKISIDTIEEKIVWDTLEDLELNLEKVSILGGDMGFDKDNIVSFHKKLFKRKVTDLALTCLRSSYDELQAAGIPSLRITLTKSAVVNALEKQLIFGESIKNKNNHLVVGIASVDQFDEVAAQVGSEHKLQRIKLEIQKIFLRFVEEIDGYLLAPASDEYTFVTTRLLFNNVSKSLTEIALIDRIKDQLSVTMALGIGIGETANQAGNHARIALLKAKERGGNACFVVSEDKRLIGPLNGTRAISQRIRTLDPETIALADRTGMTVNQFERIIGAIRSLPMQEFTANDLAPALNLSIRSIRRLLKKLLASNMLLIIGKEKIFDRGLHRRVYVLNPKQQIRV